MFGKIVICVKMKSNQSNCFQKLIKWAMGDMQACDMTCKMFSRSKKLQCKQRKPATINFLVSPLPPHHHHLIIIVYQPSSPSSHHYHKVPSKSKHPFLLCFARSPCQDCWHGSERVISAGLVCTALQVSISYIFQKTKLDSSDETFQLSMTLNRI